MDAQPLSERYWYLDGTSARRIDVDFEPFWRQLLSGEYRDEIVREVADGDGWLVSVYEMTSDTDHEEMHPNGDELHFLVSGRLDLVLDAPDPSGTTPTVIPMRPGTSALVPRRVWHRFVVHEPASALAITAGRGTEHRPAVPAPTPSPEREASR